MNAKKTDSDRIGLTETLPPETEKSLAGIKLLKNVDPEAVTRLEEICTWYACPKGAFIFDADDTSGSVFFIVEGTVPAPFVRSIKGWSD